MLDDILDEELMIMEERAQSPKVLSTDTFQTPIRVLPMREPKTLELNASIGEAIDMMQSLRIGGVMITQQGKLVGIVTERDILMKVVDRLEDYRSQPVSAIMTRNPTWLHPADPIVFLMHKMQVGGYRHIPIVDEEMKPLSMISLRDVLTFVLDFFPDEILNIPTEPFRGEYGQDGS